MSQSSRARLVEVLGEVEGPWTAEGFTPHVSLAVIREEADEGALREIVDELAKQLQPFEAQFSSMGMFPGRRPVLFLAPAANPQLLAAHDVSAQMLDQAGIEPIGYYLRGYWTPHLTLSTGMPALELVPKVKSLLRLDFAGSYDFEEIDLIEFHPKNRLVRLSL
ncbi:MAG: 2'-5' RNA ligase family protein [Verrucomicrobiota bacterium]